MARISSKAIHYWAEDQSGRRPDGLELGFVTGIEGYSSVVPRIYFCHMANFSGASTRSLAPIVSGEGLEDCQYRIVFLGGMWFCFMALEEILTTLSYLPKYPTCSEAMGRRCIRRAVKLTRPVEPFLQYGSTPWGRFWFLGN